MKITLTATPTSLVRNSLLSLFLSFGRNEKQESSFQQVGDLGERNISLFCSSQVALYFRGMSNYIDFCKRIFLYVIAARIIVPWVCRP